MTLFCRAAVLSLTFLTGTAGLVYQVTWQRQLSVLLGTETVATALVLAVFLAGLSAGYFLCGKWTLRTANPIRKYALLEGFIGCWGLVYPSLLGAVEVATEGWGFHPPFGMLVQGFLITALLIGAPTICMGGTVPMLTRALTRTLDEATRVHAWIYALNTAGAFLGTLAAAFILVERFGLRGTLWIAAAINLIAAGALYVISRNLTVASGEIEPATTTEENRIGSVFRPAQLYSIAFLSGFYVMMLENVLIRMTQITLGSSTYAFALIVSVFIFSIAAGSAVVSWLRRIGRDMLFRNQLLIAIALLLLFVTLDSWPYAAHVIRILFQSNDPGFWAYHAAVLFALLLLLLLPIGLMGITVPLIFHELRREVRRVGFHSGALLFSNGCGSLTGSILGGVVLFYFFELGTVYLFAALFAALSACVASVGLERKKKIIGLAMFAVVAGCLHFQPTFTPEQFAIGTYRLRSITPVSLSGPTEFYAWHNKFHGKVKFFRTDPTLTAAVTERRGRDGSISRALFTNGRSESRAGQGPDQRTLKLLAHIPALFAPGLRNVYLIGLGTGVTGGEVTLHPEVESLTIAEISAAVIQALPCFSEFTHGLEDDPRVRIENGDALRILRRYTKKWDVIISEPSNPFVVGVDQLFNREFFRLARERLRGNGFLMQWVQGYATRPEILALIVNTMLMEFRHLYFFKGLEFDYLILAAQQPLGKQDLDRAIVRFNGNPRLRGSLGDIGISSVEEVIALLQPWIPVLASLHLDLGIETRDRTRLHYLAGRAFFVGRSVEKERQTLRSNPITQQILMRYHENWSALDPKPVLFPDLPAD